MRASRAFVLLVASLLLFAEPATSHHSYYSVYDPARSITISGVVTQFRFVNPHSMMTMDVTDESGKVTTWTVEFDGVVNMTNGGWTARSIKTKEHITVTGSPTREADTHRMFFLKLTRADGTELVRYYDQRVNAVEEERRQRALERDKK
jgi:hypothetical protein